ncbi:hypothetical protein DV736_g3500, partial [Chaetothyriales sp. CBS 134916]
MADQYKYNPPEGQPPSYPPPAHHDAGPYYHSPSPAPGPMNQVAYYPPAQALDGTFYGAPQDRAPYEYAQQGPYQQPYYANQPPMYYQQPAPGYFPDRGRPGATEGFSIPFFTMYFPHSRFHQQGRDNVSTLSRTPPASTPTPDSTADCHLENSGYGLLAQGSLGHRFTLIAIGTLAGIILVFLITFAKNHLHFGPLQPGRKDKMSDDMPAVPGAFGYEK